MPRLPKSGQLLVAPKRQRHWRSSLLRHLSVQVLIAIALAAALALLHPELAVALKPLGDGYIRLIKMVTAPVVFLTVVLGIAQTSDVRELGRIGGKTLLYFEVVTTVALAVGLAVAHLFEPGKGVSIANVNAADISTYVAAAKNQSISDFLLHMIPESALAAFASGDVLQLLLLALLFGVALSRLGPRGAPLILLFESTSRAVFYVVKMIVHLAPLGAFGAMAFTIGKFGLGSLMALGKLLGSMYLTMAVFVFGGLGLVARLSGFSLWKLIYHIREEILVVLGTSSSESVLPSIMEKLTSFGCHRNVVGLVVPTGYSFNLDGTAIYLAMAALFVAQAYGIELSLGRECMLFGLLLVTSKGAAGVTGSGFVTLAATLSATGILPVEGMALLLGVDRFMSEARAITNLIGNSVATVVIAKLEGEYQPPVQGPAEDLSEPVT